MPAHQLLQEELCPVSDRLLGDLYGANPDGLPILVETIPPNVRAILAVYCYRRAHLVSIGLAIASSCEKNELEIVAGHFGAYLFHQDRNAPTVHVVEPISRRNITLSRGPLRQFVFDDDE